jgi:hypothetical protein
MNTLGDAWDWYLATRRNLQRMQRLGRKHWSDPTLEGASIWKDEEFKQLEPSRIVDETERSLVPLDDLAVVVLFSVFEAVVRNHLLTRIQPEAQRLVDPVLKTAAEDAIQGVREGSFFLRVLDPLGSQGQVPPDLITQVNQVRGYRNWAAHGRRDSPANVITPLVA